MTNLDDTPRKKTTKKAVAKRVSSRGRVAEVQTVSRANRVKKEIDPKPSLKPKTETKTARTTRKAPTPIASTKAAKKQKNNQLLVVFALIVVGFIASAGVGFLDSGQIDVNEAIEARNERLKNNQANEADTMFSSEAIPVQDTTNAKKADGGLKGLGTGGKKPAPAPIVSSSTATSTDLTASSTEATASSTEGIVEDVVDEEEAEEETKSEESASSTVETI